MVVPYEKNRAGVEYLQVLVTLAACPSNESGGIGYGLLCVEAGQRTVYEIVEHVHDYDCGIIFHIESSVPSDCETVDFLHQPVHDAVLGIVEVILQFLLTE